MVEPVKDQNSEEQNIKASFLDCFKLASLKDSFFLIGGISLALLNGAANAATALALSLAISAFDSRYSPYELSQHAFEASKFFLAIGINIFVGTLGSRTLLRINAQRQSYNFRRAYLKALFEQESSFFDKVNSMEYSSQMENDCKTIGDALDVQLESVFYCLGSLVCAFTISFMRSWQIALMMFAVTPFILASMSIYEKFVIGGAEERSIAYSKAGAMAQEALTNIKTVAALGGEQTELQRYNDAVKIAQKGYTKSGAFQGIVFGFSEFIFISAMAAIFYIGSTFIEDGIINPSTGEPFILADLITPVNAIMGAFSQIPILGGSLMGLSMAKIKARKILNIISQVKKSGEGMQKKMDKFCGRITFKNVSFAYPTNPDKLVLKNLSLEIKANTKIALVGESGGGKSTIMQLLQKFYDPESGVIEFDGHDLKTLDASWLRRNVAYVSQEPVIFSMTIRENLLLGKPEATEDELVMALKKANVFEFVMSLEKKLDTYIGGGVAAQISGGQKQRIAIARAILKDVRVLLLDEATSALDHLSQNEIRKTLHDLSGERTIITIAHRLSTIRMADQIVFLNKGQVEEIGTHEELMSKKGKYFALQTAQAAKPINRFENSPTHSGMESVTLYTQNENDWESEEEEDQPLIVNKPGSSHAHNKSSEEKGSETLAMIKRIWNLVEGDRKYYFMGALGCLGFGIIVPLENIVIAASASTLIAKDDSDFRQSINLLCLLMVASGVFIFTFMTIQYGFFAKATGKLIENIRHKVFYKFLRMHMAWHDEPHNKPENLANSLEVDTTNIGQLAGISIGIILQITFTYLSTLIFCFFASWQITIVGMFTLPVLVFSAFKMNSNETKGDEDGAPFLLKTETIVSEAVNNFKTVISLDAQGKFLENYASTIKQYQTLKLKTKIKSCFYEGGSFLFFYLNLILMYNIGTHLYFTERLATWRIFLAVFSLAMIALASNQLFVLIPDVARALHSTLKIFNYLDMRSQIDIEDKTKSYKGKITGHIEFVNVKFKYPTRNYQVFNNLNLEINAETHVAITGPSGSGKSTIFQLLLRLYDVDAGEILINGANIKEYDLQYLRKKICVVSQEPILFNGTIEYNLKYANEEIPDIEMREAVSKAHASQFVEMNSKDELENDGTAIGSSFITSIKPEGYQRLVGSKGDQLSGGQKQRIAIARAILRKPKILLLDEATSALDNESEILVKDSLSRIIGDLTAVSIAHRFSTIQDLEEILILKNGVITEKGPYEELVEKKGYLYQLKQEAGI